MQIKWTHNPIASVVTIDKSDEERIRLVVTKELMESDDYGFADVEIMTRYYINSLRDIHCGDCTAIPCSCVKCCAEDALKIRTTKGMSKSIGFWLMRIYDDKPEWTIHQIIDSLTYENETIDYLKYKYLKAYQEEHFPT